MSLTGNQTLGGNITCVPNSHNYTFMGALPSEIAFLSGVTSSIQTQLTGKMSLSGDQTLGANVTCTTNPNNYKFFGALPSEIAFLSGVTSSIQNQLSSKQPLGVYMTLNGDQMLSGNITCPTNPNNYKFFGATLLKLVI